LENYTNLFKNTHEKFYIVLSSDNYDRDQSLVHYCFVKRMLHPCVLSPSYKLTV